MIEINCLRKEYDLIIPEDSPEQRFESIWRYLDCIRNESSKYNLPKANSFREKQDKSERHFGERKVREKVLRCKGVRPFFLIWSLCSGVP